MFEKEGASNKGLFFKLVNYILKIEGASNNHIKETLKLYRMSVCNVCLMCDENTHINGFIIKKIRKVSLLSVMADMSDVLAETHSWIL